MGEVCAASCGPPPLPLHPTPPHPRQRPEQRPLLNTRASAPRPLLRPKAEPRAGASSSHPSSSSPLSPDECHRPEAPATHLGPASLPRGQATTPPSAHAAPGARCALGSQRLRGPARTRPAPSQLPCGEPPAPSPLLFCPRRRRWGGGGLAPPVSATIPWPGRTKRPRGRTEATGRLGSSPKRIFAHGSRGSPPWHSLQRSEREAGAGKRTGREERVRGLKGQAGKTAGRGPTVESAKVGVRNACLDGRQDLKGVPELRRQLRGNEGVPARERLNFICAWTGRTPSARPPPGEPRRTETGSWVCWREPGAGRAGGEEPQGAPL